MMPGERARVLIMVKASPEPSKTYGDTVCVAGARLNEDGSGTCVRIYPVAFRHLDSKLKFKKFEVIEVDLIRSSKDGRSESYGPNWETLTRQERNGEFKVYPATARGPILEKLLGRRCANSAPASSPTSMRSLSASSRCGSSSP